MTTLYLDEDVSLKLVPYLESFGHAVHTTRSVGRAGNSDAEQLLHAIQQRWILVTNNRRDFTMLHEAVQRWSRGLDIELAHHGIVISNQSWLAPRAAQEIADLLGRGVDITNLLVVFDRTLGWSSYDVRMRKLNPLS